MKDFIGTKRIKARPMTRGEYNEYRGFDLPIDEDPGDAGFLVEYLDGGSINHPAHKNYISWSPEEVFVNAYRAIQAMPFSMALEAMKAGHKIAREGWNGKGMFLFLVKGSTFQVNRPPLLGIYPEGTQINYSPHIDMKTADGTIVPWIASQTDLLTDDWHVVG